MEEEEWSEYVDAKKGSKLKRRPASNYKQFVKAN